MDMGESFRMEKRETEKKIGNSEHNTSISRNFALKKKMKRSILEDRFKRVSLIYLYKIFNFLLSNFYTQCGPSHTATQQTRLVTGV